MEGLGAQPRSNLSDTSVEQDVPAHMSEGALDAVGDQEARSTGSSPPANWSEAGPQPIGLVAPLHYYALHELTVKPVIVSHGTTNNLGDIPDVHPLPVVVQVLINEHGEVDRVVLGENFLSEAARQFISDSISSMKFKPGMIDDRPVRSRWQLLVNLDSAL